MKSVKKWGVALASLLCVGSNVAPAQDNVIGHSVYSSQSDVSRILNTSGECATEQCAPICCEPFWKHRHRAFADYLYLSAMDTDVTYAIPTSALGAQGTPTGAAAVISPEYESGFRVGGGWAIDDCTSIVGTFWNFDSDQYDNRQLAPAPVGTVQFLNPVLLDPNTINVVSESSVAEAFYDVDFRMVDLQVERLLSGGCSHAINGVVGVRYGRLEQDLVANYAILGTTTIDTNIDFDGVGPRFGLDGEFLIGGGFFAYGEGFANFLVGEFEGSYQQRNTFAGVQSNSSFADDRIVTLLEMEMGLGWQTQGGGLRVSSGYYWSGWFNSMTMPETLGAIQTRDFNDISEGLNFNGLTTRVELRY